MSATLRARRSRLPRADWQVPATQAALVVGFFALWEAGAASGLLDPLTWSRPSVIATELADLVGTPETVNDLAATLTTLAAGFLIGATAGVGIGIAVARLRRVQAVVSTYLVALQSVPLLVFYPVLLTIFGLNRGPTVIVVAAVTMVPVALNTTAGLGAIPRGLQRLATSLMLSRSAAYRKVFLPAAIPLIFPGLRVGFLAALVTTIGMEFIVASAGLGYRVGQSYHTFAVDRMYANIVVVCVLAILVNLVLTRIERSLRRDVTT
ncbi:ABC transporter permease [Nonomuraea sp. CA-218870]|uniref:ABC transporter permease n=1 Tax=Nonomuraea sp. CA-218870 TaxID=3239998 RepID=UPI003D8B465E